MRHRNQSSAVTVEILTNNHVVESAADNGGSITVAFNDGSNAKAEILGRDPVTDLAVIKAEGKSGLSRATLGTSADLHGRPGGRGIGSPFGLEGTVTSGIISALNRPSPRPTVARQRHGDRIPGRSRPTRRSIPATPADLSSTCRDASSASTPRSAPTAASRRATPARSDSASPSRSTSPRTSRSSSSRATRSSTRASVSPSALRSPRTTSPPSEPRSRKSPRAAPATTPASRSVMSSPPSTTRRS